MADTFWKCASCGSTNPRNVRRCRGCNQLSQSEIPATAEFQHGPDYGTAAMGSQPEAGSPASVAAAMAPSNHWLVATAGPLAGRAFPLHAAGVKIGRLDKVADIVIPSTDVSRIHAVLRFNGNNLEIEDHSANGTFVNGARIGTMILRLGDRIQFGVQEENSLVYQSSAAVAPKTPAKPSPARSSAPAAAGAVAGEVETETSTIRVLPGDETIISFGALQLVLDQYAVETFPINPLPMVLGSAEESSIRIQDPSVARAHAEVSVQLGKGVVVRDLGTSSGTFVNGERVTSRQLEEGDLIRLGKCETRIFLFRQARPKALVLRDHELAKPRIVIGRDPAADIRVQHPTVSRVHAEIRHGSSGSEIIDRNSSNGTFVNGERVTRARLRPKDKITVGSVQLVFDGDHIEEQTDGTRVRLTARSLTRAIIDPNSQKQVKLLNDISLAVEPNEFVALLGPSGAGKTTLLHALSGVRPSDQGRVMLNNWSLYQHPAALRTLVGFVPQDDIVHAQLSVREALTFAARMRLPSDTTPDEWEHRIDEVLRLLELRERQDVAIGELSGGQRKRVNVALELLSKPALLFLDEPTAGQDPSTEIRMMQSFREIANSGSTVVLTTHLLASFSLLDKVAVLAAGRLAYYGPALEMARYFQVSRPQQVFDALRNQTPAEWERRFRESTLYSQYVFGPVGDFRSSSDNSAMNRGADEIIPLPTSLGRQLSAAVARQFTIKFKDWRTPVGLLVPITLIAGLLGFLQSGPNEPRTLLMMLFAGLWFGCSAAVREFVDERAIYKRERQRGFALPAYLSSKLLFAALVSATQSLLLVTVLTLFDGQSNHFGAAWLMCAVMTFQGALIGLLISAVAKTPAVALNLFPLVLIPQLLLAGLLLPVQERHPFTVTKSAGDGSCATGKHSPSGVCLEEAPAWVITSPLPVALARGVSWAVVERWGLEGLSDVYVHDYARGDADRAAVKYGLQNMGAIAVTLHPNDESTVRRQLEQVSSGQLAWKDVGAHAEEDAFLFYLEILAGFAMVMIALIALALRAS